MKRITRLLAALFIISMQFCTAHAQNRVTKIDISVVINDDGSANIVQNWNGTFTEGTENYIPINTDGIDISDLRVSDTDGEYDYIGDWDVDADFDEKSRKCGINQTADGVELCFGISEYGENSYAIEYTVTDFIKSYSDFDGTNFMLINSNMSTFPTDGKIKITLQNGTPLDAENAAIWGFGYDGEIEFSDGAVSAYTTAALEGDNSMIIMLRLNKGIVSPSAYIDKSFEAVKDKAFEGSDYGYDEYEDLTVVDYIILFTILISIPVLIILLIFMFLKRRREIKKFYKEANYFRDIPCGGNIEKSYYLSQRFNVAGDESLIIGALILSMINNGELEPQTEEKIGVFGKVKQSINIKLVREPEKHAERQLYAVLKAAAGGDGILQERELENYAYRNPKSVNGIFDSTKETGKAEFISGGGFITNRAGRKIKDLSEIGKSELAEVMGLKKYLNDFSLISEREINETIIWKEYLVYATLFGIADKVIKQMKEVYPDRIPEIDTYNRNVMIAHSYYYSMNNSAQRAIQEQRTSGMGGHASVGGGGGFSGGGSGGGSR